jgi:hypothetical protein
MLKSAMAVPTRRLNRLCSLLTLCCSFLDIIPIANLIPALIGKTRRSAVALEDQALLTNLTNLPAFSQIKLGLDSAVPEQTTATLMDQGSLPD